MIIAKYASGIELVFNPLDFLAIYLTAKAFNVDVCVLTENVEWLFISTRCEKQMMDIKTSVIYNGGFKFTSTSKFNY